MEKDAPSASFFAFFSRFSTPEPILRSIPFFMGVPEVVKSRFLSNFTAKSDHSSVKVHNTWLDVLSSALEILMASSQML